MFCYGGWDNLRRDSSIPCPENRKKGGNNETFFVKFLLGRSRSLPFMETFKKNLIMANLDATGFTNSRLDARAPPGVDPVAQFGDLR